MAQPYVGEIRMFGGNFEPNGWRFCNGQLLPISENETLFQLIGVTYGGDNESTFALPDLRGRVPVHQGNGVTPRTGGGRREQSRSPSSRSPSIRTRSPARRIPRRREIPGGSLLAQDQLVGADLYLEDTPLNTLAPTAVTPTGGGQPHSNMQPYQGITYIISLFGIFPSAT